MSNGVVSAVCWVPCGVAKPMPDRYEPTDEEKAIMREYAAHAMPLDDDAMMDDDDDDDDEDDDDDAALDDDDDDDDAMAGPSRPSRPSGPMSEEDVVREFGLDTYDEEEDMADLVGGNAMMAMMGGADPFAGGMVGPDDDDDDDELDDMVIKPTDALVLAAVSQEELCHLEVHVYEVDEDNLYPHHHLLLPAYPLSVAWMDYSVNPEARGHKGNFAAVGTFLPAIEIWDLDMMDALEPVLVLGGEAEGSSMLAAAAAETSKKKKGKKGKKKGGKAWRPGSHTDAVMGLAWNPRQRNVLASSSADATVKLWDLEHEQCIFTFDHHADKVQAVEWHPSEATVMATAGYDRVAAVFDVRQPTATNKFALTADPEDLAWNPFAPEQFVVATEDGVVAAFDARNNAKPIYNLSAHDVSTTSVCFSPGIRDCMVTCSVDKTLKVWDTANNRPSCAYVRNEANGALFSVSFCGNSPSSMAIAGQKGGVQVWDMLGNRDVRACFAERAPEEALRRAAKVERDRRMEGAYDEDDDE